jgi:hypothetical protein
MYQSIDPTVELIKSYSFFVMDKGFKVTVEKGISINNIGKRTDIVSAEFF